jgi:hypothetical protein
MSVLSGAPTDITAEFQRGLSIPTEMLAGGGIWDYYSQFELDLNLLANFKRNFAQAACEGM